MKPRNYDATIAGIAGNIAPSLIAKADITDPKTLAVQCVCYARAIVAEVIATEPKHEPGCWPNHANVLSSEQPEL